MATPETPAKVPTESPPTPKAPSSPPLPLGTPIVPEGIVHTAINELGAVITTVVDPPKKNYLQ